MDLSLSESQQLLRESVREFMTREVSRRVLVDLQTSETGSLPTLWSQAAELGWLGICVPEALGGVGASLTDTAVMFEEFGRGPLSGPFFSSSVLGVEVLSAMGDSEQQQRLLPAIASGEVITALALTEADYGWAEEQVQLSVDPTADGYVLTGTKLFVSDAPASTHLIVAGRLAPGPGGVGFLLVDRRSPGLSVRLLPGMLKWQAEVCFDGVHVSHDDLIGGRAGTWERFEDALFRAMPVLCAYQVGGCQAVCDMSVEYSRERVQFGQPIGRFQRVQDHIVRLLCELDAARWTTYKALSYLDAGRPARAEVHVAKAVSSNAYWEACNAAHEVHAGIGVDLKFGLTLHTQMARTLYSYLGDPRWHRRHLADVLGW